MLRQIIAKNGNSFMLMSWKQWKYVVATLDLSQSCIKKPLHRARRFNLVAFLFNYNVKMAVSIRL